MILLLIFIINIINSINCQIITSNTSSLLSSSYQSYCNHHHHINGSWIKVNQTRKSFYCCSWDNNDYLNMNGYCEQSINNDVNFFQGNSIYSSQSGAHSCLCDAEGSAEGSRTNPNTRENYEWVSNNCTMITWDAILFCELLGTKKVLLVGDSTMLQTSVTLMSMITTYGGKCANQITFGLSNFVVAESPGTLIDYVDKVIPDIVIVNIGAWMHDFKQFEAYFNAIMDNIKTIRQKEYYSNRQRPLFFWKGQNPGHQKCEDHPNNIYTEEEYYKYNIPIDWGWHLHRSFDKHAMSKAKENQIVVMDLWPLFLRPDGHIYQRDGTHDCLHYCLPGALDIVPKILLQLLYNHHHQQQQHQQ